MMTYNEERRRRMEEEYQVRRRLWPIAEQIEKLLRSGKTIKFSRETKWVGKEEEIWVPVQSRPGKVVMYWYKNGKLVWEEGIDAYVDCRDTLAKLLNGWTWEVIN